MVEFSVDESCVQECVLCRCLSFGPLSREFQEFSVDVSGFGAPSGLWFSEERYNDALLLESNDDNERGPLFIGASFEPPLGAFLMNGLRGGYESVGNVLP